MLVCKKCKITPDNDECFLDLHHIIPKKIGGTDKDGRMYLCSAKKGNDCHRILHKLINKTNNYNKIKEITLKFIEGGKDGNTKTIEK